MKNQLDVYEKRLNCPTNLNFFIHKWGLVSEYGTWDIITIKTDKDDVIFHNIREELRSKGNITSIIN